MKRRLLAAAAVTLMGVIMAGFVDGAEPKVGEEAPAFSLKGSDGKTYELSAFRGQKAVVVAWYPKAFTGG